MIIKILVNVYKHLKAHKKLLWRYLTDVKSMLYTKLDYIQFII